MQFSPQQQSAITKASAWLKQCNSERTLSQPFFYLAGYAGTGKSTLAEHLSKLQDGPTCYGAFTGKAANVMRDNGCVDASTIHSLIYRFEGVEETVDGDNEGEEHKIEKLQFEWNSSGPCSAAGLIIIDECYTGDVEVLTSSGFKRFDELNKSDILAQYDLATSQIDFAKPSSHTMKFIDDEIINFKSPQTFDLSVTPNHDMIVFSNDKPSKAKASSVNELSGHMKVAGYGVGPSKHLSVEEKLAIAFQADGHSDCRPYNTSKRIIKSVEKRFGFTMKSDHLSMTFTFSKQRKIDQFLSDFSSSFEITEKRYEGQKRVFKVRNVPARLAKKEFTSVFCITDFSATKAIEFVNYVKLWDGYDLPNQAFGYSNTNYNNASFVQCVATLAGLRSSLREHQDNRKVSYNTCYKVNILQTDQVSCQSLKEGNRTLKKYKGFVYCATMPKGTLIVRRGGKVLVCGNCSMVDEALAIDLLRYGKPILVLGDPGQLPPVGGAGYFVKGKPDAMLDEIHRQASGSPIIQLATEIRTGNFDRQYCDKDGLLIVDGKDERIAGAAMGAGALIVGKNQTRHSYNDRMRMRLGFNKSKYPVKGETLICLKNDKTLKIFNGEIWEVAKSAEEITVNGQPMIRMILVSPDNPRRKIKVKVHTCFFDRTDTPHWTLLKETQQFDFGYVLTCHKAQGSSYSDVLVFDESSIFKENADRWLYTAVTRASENLTLVI